MSKMNICKNEENCICGNNEVVVYNPLKITRVRNMLKKILKIEPNIRFYGSCGTDLGRSIAEVTDNIHAIVVS